jgi:hypothetical protein
MADTIALTLTGTTQGEIQGDSSISSSNRANTIEVLSLEQEVFVHIDRATLEATGRRSYVPFTFVKRIDKATPKLRQALITNELLTGEFRWFRPNPDGSGSTQHFFTVSFTGGRVNRSTLILPDTRVPPTASQPPMESVEMVFAQITVTFEPGGITSNDAISNV